MSNILNEIAKYCGTDKSSENHNYCIKYEKYLPFNRYDEIKILEIGVLNGGSLKMWADYYYRSNVVGIDIDPNCKQHEHEGIKIEIGSQTDKKFLDDLINKYNIFDLIIDDGSHINSDVIFSFENLFKSIKSGGVYVVEDSSTSYWDAYNGGNKLEGTTMEYFKNLTDDVNFRGLLNIGFARREDFLIDLSHESQPNCRTDIESINFLNGLILITKR